MKRKKFNPKKKSDKVDLYQQVTDKIIQSLEAGVGPWIKPWNDSDVSFGLHRNANSGHIYRGVNVLLLNMVAYEKGYSDPRWLTFRDAQKLGGHIRKGEKSSRIVFWKFLDIKENSEEHDLDPKAKKVIPLLRVYNVFNVEQCEDLEIDELAKPENDNIGKVNPEVEAILLVPVIRTGGNRAFYSSSHDFIQIPPISSFESQDHYYGTCLHEVAHWTGHESRLNRTFGKRFGDRKYAFEELVAEIGSAFLGGHTGLSFKEMRHPEYIKSWIKTLKGDKNAIFTACRFSQAAADYALDQVQNQQIQAVEGG